MKYGFLIFLIVFVFALGFGFLISEYWSAQNLIKALEADNAALVRALEEERAAAAVSINELLNQIEQLKSELSAAYARIADLQRQLEGVVANLPNVQPNQTFYCESGSAQPAQANPETVFAAVFDLIGLLDDMPNRDIVLILVTTLSTTMVVKFGDMMRHARQEIDRKNRAYYHNICMRQRGRK